MAPHSSTLAWKIPWAEEPGRLQSMGSLRVRHDWVTDFTFTFHFHALEKEMATHSSVLALRIPGTGEPGGLPSMGSHRVGCDWSDLAAAACIYIHIYIYIYIHFPPQTVLWFCGPERVTSVILHTLLQWRNPDRWETLPSTMEAKETMDSLFCR